MKSDIVLLILNCYKYREKALKQKRTWLKDLPKNILYFHLIGDSEKCKEKEHLFDYDENILYVNTKDDYNSLPAKIITALNAVNETIEYKYVFKTDDDQMLIDNNFFTSLPSYLQRNNQHHYGGFVVKVPEHISTYYTVHDCLPRDLLLKECMYCNGRFYFLSKEVIVDLIIKKDEIKKQIIEDHGIGLFVSKEFKKTILNFDTKNTFYDETCSVDNEVKAERENYFRLKEALEKSGKKLDYLLKKETMYRNKIKEFENKYGESIN